MKKSPLTKTTMMKKTLTLLACCLTLTAQAHRVEKTPATDNGTPAATFTHPWQGRRVAYIGDSITDPRNKTGKHKYWKWLQEWLNIEPYVYGVSGKQWNDVLRQADKLNKDHGQEVDAICIFLGTNDWNNNVPLGEWYTLTDDSVLYVRGSDGKHMELRRHRTLNRDMNTLRGRINTALDSLKRMYPTKQIILLTPLHRARFYANEKNWQPTEDYANRLGLFIDDYVQCVKEAGNVWAVHVIDWNATSGLYPMHECQPYFGHDNDRLHPNDEGQRRMARTLYYQLLTLPCEF